MNDLRCSPVAAGALSNSINKEASKAGRCQWQESAQVHNRMPMILPEEHHAKWLDEAKDGDLKELLKTFLAEHLKMSPISSRTHDPKNNDEDIITLVAC